jgi:hypothetical protein
VFVRLLHGTEAPSYWNFFGIVGILHTKMRSMDHHCKHWGMLGLIRTGDATKMVTAFRKCNVLAKYGMHPTSGGKNTFKTSQKSGKVHSKLANGAGYIAAVFAEATDVFATETAVLTELAMLIPEYISVVAKDNHASQMFNASQDVLALEIRDAGYVMRLAENACFDERILQIPSNGQHAINVPAQYLRGERVALGNEEVVERSIGDFKTHLKHTTGINEPRAVEAMRRHWTYLAHVGDSEQKMQTIVDSAQANHQSEIKRDQRRKLRRRVLELMPIAKLGWRSALLRHITWCSDQVWNALYDPAAAIESLRDQLH